MIPDGDGCGNKRLVVLLAAWDECVMYPPCACVRLLRVEELVNGQR